MEVAELGQAPPFQKSNPNVQYPPFRTLIGEHALLLSKTTEGTAMVTNFRFFVYERCSFINVPLMMIGEVIVADAYCWLKVCCKDAATYSCTFATVEDCQACVTLLREKTGLPRSVKDIFAYRFYALTIFQGSFDRPLTSMEADQVTLCKPVNESFRYTFGKEVERQGFDTNKRKIWRMTQANEKFEFCATYPEYHIVPAAIDDAELQRSLEFRAMKRFPSVVWRARNIGVVLMRSSQPMNSFLGLSYFSNQADVSLLEKIVEACHKEREAIEEDHQRLLGRALLDAVAQGSTNSGGSSGENDGGAQGSLVAVEHAQASGHGASNGTLQCGDIGKLAIVDCRSVATVWGNSFKGGGTEDEVVYKCSIVHLDLANIHSVRDSFIKLRTLCYSYPEGNYFKSLSGCNWLAYISALLRGANVVVDLMQVKRRPVLVHCSDGWDRTSQICSLSELMMDKYYRTLEGFQVLVEREWLHFGHKFAERGGHDVNCSDVSQISPIFLQFLDCVYQLTVQYPAEFQFNEAYLVKLLQHSQACLFGTFLHNSERERKTSECTASVWSLLHPDNSHFVNLLYKPSQEVLIAKCTEHDVILWKKVYMAGLSPWRHGSQADFHMDSSLLGSSAGDEAGGAPRSKSMDDLSRALGDAGRRNSDPLLSPNQDLAAAGQGVAAPLSGGSIHDTSSSSVELLHYPDDSSPGSMKSGDVKAEETNLQTKTETPSKDSVPISSPKSEKNSFNGGDTGSPYKIPVKESVKDELSQQQDCKNETMNIACGASAAGAVRGAESQGSPKDLSPKAQSLMPSSSSVFSGQDDVSEASVSNGSPKLCSNTNPAMLLVAQTADAAVTVNGTAVIVSDSINSMQGLSTPSNLCVSGSMWPIPCEHDVPGAHAHHLNGFAREATVTKDCALQSSQVGQDLALTILPPSSPPKLSSPSSPSSLNCGSSLLSERLALNNEMAHKLDRTNSQSLPATSLPSVALQAASQHSRPRCDGRNLAVKFKADTSPIDSSTIANGGLTTATDRTFPNGVSHCSPVYHNDRSTSPVHLKHVQRQLHQQQRPHGSGGEDIPQSLSESTDTLVDQPLCVDIKHHMNGSSAKRTPLRGASHSSSSLSVSPSSSYSSPAMLMASPQQRRDLSSTPDSPQYIQSRRARAASGASRDLSVSPGNNSVGMWSDVGRLRNPSGGGEVATRRLLGATVATSTTDISDSFVGKVGSKALALMERGPSMRKHLDMDTLTLFCDERQDLLSELLADKDRKILELEARLCQARDIIKAYRERQQQQCTSSPHMNGHSALLDELSITEAEGGELGSLGTLSNAASDASWEAIEDSEEKIVMWVPDSLVTHCAGCDGQFWMAKRKHHCRNCGKVFCWECSNYLAPVPHQHLNKPQRVCSRCHSSLLQLSPGASSDGRIPTLVADG